MTIVDLMGELVILHAEHGDIDVEMFADPEALREELQV